MMNTIIVFKRIPSFFGYRPKPKMQIVASQNVADGDDCQTWVLAHQDSKLYFAIYSSRIPEKDLDCTDPSTWVTSPTAGAPEEIIPADVYPEHKPEYTSFESPENANRPDVYYKSYRFGQLLRPRINLVGMKTREIQTCEEIRKHPHPNIAEYLGVWNNDMLSYKWQGKTIRIPLDKERVIKLVFKKYDCNLEEAVDSGQDIDIAHCLRSIATGLEHLHDIGIVHSDIKPENAFVSYPKTGENTAAQYVIGDFDSAQYAGNFKTGKAGTTPWARYKKDGDVIEEDDDWYAFRK
jgi:serine/threonine protein kinase